MVQQDSQGTRALDICGYDDEYSRIWYIWGRYIIVFRYLGVRTGNWLLWNTDWHGMRMLSGTDWNDICWLKVIFRARKIYRQTRFHGVTMRSMKQWWEWNSNHMKLKKYERTNETKHNKVEESKKKYSKKTQATSERMASPEDHRSNLPTSKES